MTSAEKINNAGLSSSDISELIARTTENSSFVDVVEKGEAYFPIGRIYHVYIRFSYC